MTNRTGMNATLRCVLCSAEYDAMKIRYRCDCGGTLDAVFHPLAVSAADLDARLISKHPHDRSGVWRYRELILPIDPAHIVTWQEGNTGLYDSDRVAEYVGCRIALKHEGQNPSGSFKDRGMTAGVSMARALGVSRVACASTGNTSASMAAYAAAAGMQAIVFIPNGKIAYGKLSQAMAYGAQTIQIDGDFDDAMGLVQQVCGRSAESAGLYLLNSVNPFRIEGQKAIGIELLHDRDWRVPDWIVLPGGNLGNSSALAKGLAELKAAGLIDRLPRIAIVQAAGANPLYTAWRDKAPISRVRANTLATAIQIGDPVSGDKAWRGLTDTDGVVVEVTDQEILDAKAVVDRAGIGAEPASCATVAGARQLVAAGIIAPDADVCGILTGNLLKDPDVTVGYHTDAIDDIKPAFANPPIRVDATLDAVLRVLDV